MSARGVNLRQLADHLGLSPTTVSRALNGFPEVSETTRARVVEAARMLDYSPNPSATSLATGRSKTVAHVVPLAQHRMMNPHFADFLAGAGLAYAKAGYDLLLRVVDPEEEAELYREFARRKRVDGVVISAPQVDEPRIALLRELGLPFIVHGRSDNETEPYCYLDVDNRSAFLQATRHLLELGHRRIGLVNGFHHLNFAARRLSGYRDALEEAGLALDQALVHSADLIEPYGFEATQTLLDLADPPTAILYASILPAMGGHRALQLRGLEPGQDVSLMTYDDLLSFLPAHEERPLFTSVESSIFAAGSRLAEILLERLSNPSAAPAQEIWQAKFRQGRSTGPVPA